MTPDKESMVKATLKSKIIALAVFSALLPVVANILFTFQMEESIAVGTNTELEKMARDTVSQVAEDVYTMCQTFDVLFKAKSFAAGKYGELLIKNKGAVTLIASETVEWDMVDPVTKFVSKIYLPRIKLGNEPIERNYDPQKPALIVDDLAQAMGGVCTIFQIMNDAGDMIRVASSIKVDGKRAIGTVVLAKNSDNSLNPIVEKITKGETYHGMMYVVNDTLLAYGQPIRDVTGKIIGGLFIAQKIQDISDLRKAIKGINFGNSGYVSIVGAKGEKRGTYILSKDNGYDGVNFWNTASEDGSYLIRDAVTNSMKSENGEYFFRYLWRNPGETLYRKKIGVAKYFQPWEWVLIPSLYEEDYLSPMGKIQEIIDSQLRSFLALGFLVLGIAAALAYFMGKRMTKPLKIIVGLAEKISSGNLVEAKKDLVGLPLKNKDVDLSGGDEIIHLFTAFHLMTNNLDSLIGQVQRTCIQVTSSSTEIASSARQLEATVTEQSASTKEVTSSSKEILFATQGLNEAIAKVGKAVTDAGAKTETGRSSLTRMENSLRQLMKSTESISSKLAIINNKTAKISWVVSTINKISDQTNLLSLNAGIEAEKAGEFGRGFSVVSREISRLADQTASATQDVETMVREMRESVTSGVVEMDKFAEGVRHEVRAVGGVGQELGEIIDLVRNLSPQFDTVEKAVVAQSTSALQISEAMTQLGVASDSNKDALLDFKQATEHLRNVVQEMRNEVSRFKLE